MEHHQVVIQAVTNDFHASGDRKNAGGEPFQREWEERWRIDDGLQWGCVVGNGM